MSTYSIEIHLVIFGAWCFFIIIVDLRSNYPSFRVSEKNRTRNGYCSTEFIHDPMYLRFDQHSTVNLVTCFD